MAEEKSFEMTVSKVLQIQGGRIVACGKISKGSLAKGDEVYLDKADGSAWKICIAGIENNRKLVEKISEGNEVGLLLSATGFSKENVNVGDVLYKETTNANDSESDFFSEIFGINDAEEKTETSKESFVDDILADFIKKAKEAEQKKDYKLALEHYLKASDYGDSAEAQCQIGEYYYNVFQEEEGYEADGLSDEQCLDKAIEYYQKAAEKGNKHAEYKLYETFFDKGEKEKAFKMLEESAESGNLESQNMLGTCKTFERFGMEINEEEGVKWYRMAAEQGYAEAQCNLAFCYKRGIGVEPDMEEAYKWYKIAAEQGYPEGQDELGNCYELGIGVEENPEEAYKWYRKAAEQGDADAQCDVGDCYKDGIGVEVDFYQTIEWYTKALEQGEARAQYFIGYCYEMGDGMEENKEMAYNLYQKAAEQGYANAQYRLGLCYEHGRGTEIDVEKAYAYYKIAADNMVPAPLACMKIANAYYSQIDSGLDAIGRTSAMVAASVLIPITSFITIPAALFGSSAVRASKKKKFLATEAGKDMMKYYYIAADRGNEEAKEKIEELSQYL